jgi:hypothetical protein
MPTSKRHSISKPTARKAEFFSGDGMIQKANAASRKATGRHNRADRTKWSSRKVADVDLVSCPDKSWKSCEPWEKLDAPGNRCANGPKTIPGWGVKAVSLVLVVVT